MSEKHVKYCQQLRAEAKANVARVQAVPHAAEALLQELRVRQTELEMQNAALRQAHVALEESHNRYVDLYKFAPMGYFTISTEGLITEINLKAAAMLGLLHKSLIQLRFEQFVADEDKDRWYRLSQRMIMNVTEHDQSLDLLLIRDDGSTFNAHLDCLRIGGADARPMLRIAFVDIIQLKQTKAELRVAAIAFESQDGIFITDANSVVLKVNKAYTSITGYSAEESVGQPPRLLQSGRHNVAFFVTMWENINRLGFWSGEIWNRRKSGEEYPEHLTITAVSDSNGVVTNYVAILIDITESKQHEQQRLADESRHRDTLVREVHHRIKNNLQGVTGILRNFVAQYPALAVPIDGAISQVQSIAVIHGLQGRAALTKVRLCELVKEIAANSESLWQTSVAVDIPPQWIPWRITEAEAVPLALVLNELISNAVKHGDLAKGINIALRRWPLPHKVQVTISNPGRLLADFNSPDLPTAGTGLKLVASLLPKKGTCLSWEQCGDDVITLLELAAPIITLEQPEMKIS